MKLFQRKKIIIRAKDDLVEIVEISFVEGHGIVTSIIEKEIEEGIIEFGQVKNRKALKNILREIFKERNGQKFEKSRIYFSVLEDNVYSNLLYFENNKELDRDVLEQLKKKLPEELDEYNYHYRNLNQIESIEEEDKSLAYSIAIKRDFIKSWSALFRELGHSLYYFIPQSVLYGYLLGLDEHNIIVCNLELKNASISAFLDGQIFYSNSINTHELIDKDSVRDNFKKINFSEKSINSSLYRDFIEGLVLEIEQAVSYIKKITGRDVDLVYLDGEFSVNRSLIGFLEKEIDYKKIKIKSLDHSKLPLKKIKNKILPSFALGDVNCSLERFCFEPYNNFIGKDFYKNKFKKTNILIIFYFLLIFILLLSFIYFLGHREEKNIKPVYHQTFYSQEDLFYYEISLTTNDIAKKDQIKGRVFEINFNEAADLETIIKKSREILEKEKLGSEFYWEEPLEGFKDGESLIFPLKTKWFIGERESLEGVIDDKVRNKLLGNDYQLEIYKDSPVELSIYDGLYLTKIKIKVKHNFDINKYNLKETKQKRVIIVNTNNKKINIRKGPGTEYKIIGKAREGEDYTYIRTLDSWANITLVNGEKAWISEYFVKVLE